MKKSEEGWMQREYIFVVRQAEGAKAVSPINKLNMAENSDMLVEL